MADVQVSQFRTLLVTDHEAPFLDVSQFSAKVILGYPSKRMDVSYFEVRPVVKPLVNVEVSQFQVLAVIKGRIENRRVRAWGFTLDGHDFYVLRLGETETLVYDLTTDQWMQWDDASNPVWRAQIGGNWVGAKRANYQDGLITNVVAGDHNYGILWTLNPSSGVDMHPTIEEEFLPFTRQVVGGLPMRMRNTQKIGAAYLTASVGVPQYLGANISLRTSDDNGKNWTSHGTITAEIDNFNQEFVWRSLGLLKAPGKIFEFTDDGATVRLDGLDIR